MKELALSINGTPFPVPSGIPGGVTDSGSHILSTLLTLSLIITVALALIFLIWGGIRWTMSRGDPKAVEGARNQITYAIVGIIVAFLALAIVTIIGGFFHIELFKLI